MARKKAGKDAFNQVFETIRRELRKTPEGRELLNNDSQVVHRLAYFVCRDLGLICEYVNNGLGEDYMLGCTEAPRGRCLCLYHYRKKYMKYVFDEDAGKKVQKYELNKEKKETKKKIVVKIGHNDKN